MLLLGQMQANRRLLQCARGAKKKLSSVHKGLYVL